MSETLRHIVHLDADAFFASVEQASDVRLRGRPIAVGGERRGIIASASYEARKMGVYTPMPTSRARKLCPKLIVIPGDFEKYERFSQWMFSYAYDFTPDVEVTSIDEGYLDLSGLRKNPVEVARTLRDAIRQSLKITVSEGLGANKLVSQIASKLNKPAAFASVPIGDERRFLEPLPNRWLPGVGPVTSERLNAAGLARIGQVAVTPLELLELLVGSGAPSLRQFACGLDDRPLCTVGAPAQSYGQQETFDQDQTDEAFLEAVLRKMADQLMARVRADRRSARTVTVKVRYNDMAEDQYSESLLEPTDLETDLYSRLPVMLKRAWKRRVSLRLVSLKLSNIHAGVFRLELPLESLGRDHDAKRRLAQAIDELRHHRGYQSILRGHDLLLRDREARPAPEAPMAPIPSSRVEVRMPRPLPGAQGVKHPSPAVRMRKADGRRYVPLAVRSHYSFLHSTLSPEAAVQKAVQSGHAGIALCDQGNLHGAVPFMLAAQKAGLPALLGAEITIEGKTVQLYVENQAGYERLCRLLSDPCLTLSSPAPSRDTNTPTYTYSAPDPDRSVDLDQRRAAEDSRSGLRERSVRDLERWGTEGLIAVAGDAVLQRWFPGRLYCRATSVKQHRQRAVNLPGDVPVVASLPVHYGTAEDRWKWEVVQSIRTRTLLKQAHPEKVLTGQFHYRSALELEERFKEEPGWLENTLELAERCRSWKFPFGPPQFPPYRTPTGESSASFLRQRVLEGARQRYPESRWPAVLKQVEMELGIIHAVGYEDYFLIVWDLLQACRARDIEWITRGSAADSLVCYCLGISGVCPLRFDLYFRRFLNPERMALNKLPDIDIDFPHDRKDDVMGMLLARYGAEHAAVVGGFSTFQARSAVAEIAKVLGVSEHQIRRFTEHFPWSFRGGWMEEKSGSGSSDLEGRRAGLREQLRANPETADLPLDEEPYRSAVDLAEFLDGFPRYPKMHPCGVVLSRQPMHSLTPTFQSNKGYATTHFDMDAVELVGLVKMDILAQGGLAVMRDVRHMLAKRGIHIDLETCTVIGTERQASLQAGAESETPVSNVPRVTISEHAFDESTLWEMIASGNARAVHHIESPAMVSLCRMCHVRDIDGLIAIVSVIRPGAANEQKKVRFTRRYQGLEPVTYPHPSLVSCLRSTFGLVVYEEHILQICEAFAGLGGGRADVLRRALVKLQWPVVEAIGKEFVQSALARGRRKEDIVAVWELVTGFNGYAFCKAHSTAYGVEAYQSAWLKLHFPAEFMAGVLTQGKGFYHPLVYVLECHRLGIPLLPPCIQNPGPQFQVVDSGTPHTRPAIRVPIPRVQHISDATWDKILTEHQKQPFESLRDFYRRVRPSADVMSALIRVGAFDGFGELRTRQFWEFQQAYHVHGRTDPGGQAWLLPPPGLERLPEVPLTEPSRFQRLQWENELLGYTASGHPLELHSHIAWDTYCPVAELQHHVGQEVVTCGLVIEQRIHHQATGEPMKFLTLCDGTGMVETELFAATYRSYGLATVRYPVLEITARVEPFENSRGYTLRVMRAGKPREKTSSPAPSP